MVVPPDALPGLKIRVALPETMNAAAQALGWPQRMVPWATVVLQRIEPPSAVADTVSTDSEGTLEFQELEPGDYQVRASRDFSAEERALAGVSLGESYALEGFARVGMGLSGTDATIVMNGVTRGTLVFSELYPTAVRLTPSGYWQWGSYFELYNNSEFPVDLANLLFVDAVVIGVDSPNFPCTDYADIQRDPSGIWADFVYRFPSDAAPVAPGEKIVVATDAIDHRQFGSGIGFHDLSNAPYEFRGSSDTDNPLAKDVVSVGPRLEPFGHGWFGFALRNLIALATPLDLDTLPRRSHAEYAIGTPLVRIPTAALIDVVQWNTTFDRDYAYCPASVVAEIDTGEPRIIYPEDTVSMHRRIRYRLSDGRPVLQKSRNSAADWTVAPGTPGQVP